MAIGGIPAELKHLRRGVSSKGVIDASLEGVERHETSDNVMHGL